MTATPGTGSLILAIDPGPSESAYLLYDGTRPVRFGKVANDVMLWAVLPKEMELSEGHAKLVIEQVAAMGMAVGAEVFETVFWSGRFAQNWHSDMWDRLKRHEVKMHLCRNMRAKDANIRQSLLDRFGPGREQAIGTKKKQGPLYGISGDCWSALAIAVTYADTISHRREAQRATA